MSSQDSSTDNGDDVGLDAVLPGGYQASGNPGAPEPLARVDQVALRKLGGFNFITPLQWVGMGREERMRLIKSEAAVFLSEGQEVPIRAALEYLKELADGLPHGPPPGAQSWQPEPEPPQAEPPAGDGRSAGHWPPPTSRPPSLVDEPLDPGIRPRDRSDERHD